ncbi:hypothetical protein [Wolbachia endosymbiont of Ctenocephalides felis wCfeT]|uniref:hypothetical protein n=1 Tax=Wolbachia endosymbiont of Ctenocephalides felis wCfeT TaxID=2732593 RepID=UPI001446F967|nr:hypothetical protein [Wolbachia endosymbiont of Ctenocephalides felis wCfeT]
MGDSRKELFYEIFNIHGQDRLLLPKNIGKDVIFSSQVIFSYYAEQIRKAYIENNYPKGDYEETFSYSSEEEVGGICIMLCEYVSNHNLLSDKKQFSEKIPDHHYTDKKCKKRNDVYLNMIIDLIKEDHNKSWLNGPASIAKMRRILVKYGYLDEKRKELDQLSQTLDISNKEQKNL